jgi:hypothetical protein
LNQAIQRAAEYGPPDDYVHDSQVDGDEPEGELPAPSRLALMVERRQSNLDQLNKKPMSAIEQRQHARLVEKQARQSESM